MSHLLHVTGMDIFIGALLVGYVVARCRLHRHLKDKRARER